jgi:hypothetical protein
VIEGPWSDNSRAFCIYILTHPSLHIKPLMIYPIRSICWKTRPHVPDVVRGEVMTAAPGRSFATIELNRDAVRASLVISESRSALDKVMYVLTRKLGTY